MSLTKKHSRAYTQSTDEIYAAAKQAVVGLKGKMLSENAGNHTMHVQMDKKIEGKVLGDRTQMEIAIVDGEESGSMVKITIYPINPVGQKLMFGARKGVIPEVLKAFYRNLDAQL